MIQIIEFEEWVRLRYSDKIIEVLQEVYKVCGDMVVPTTAKQTSNDIGVAMACFGNMPNQDTMSKIFTELINEDDIKPNIPQLKKRIKYCRNPMEKKKLQQELNQAYKEQKRGHSGKIQKETSSD